MNTSQKTGAGRWQRTVVLVLAAVIALAAALVPNTSAEAAPIGDDYPYGTAGPYHGDYEWGTPSLDPWNFYKRNCTSFVAHRLRSVNGVSFTNQYKGLSRWGHAAMWDDSARSAGIRVNTTPARGAVAQWDGGYGHVAWISEVRDAGRTIVVEEYNYRGDGRYSSRTLTRGSAGWPSAFIHVKDLSGSTDARSYAGSMVRRPDGAVYLVKDDGRRYHVPSGGDFQALRNNGVALQNLTTEQVNAIPGSGQQARVRRHDDPTIGGPSRWITAYNGTSHGYARDYKTTTSAAGRSYVTNEAVWTLKQAPGVHRIKVYVPTRHAVARVVYDVYDGNRHVRSVSVDQRNVYGWHTIDQRRFTSSTVRIKLRDHRGAGPYNTVIGLDAAELVPLR